MSATATAGEIRSFEQFSSAIKRRDTVSFWIAATALVVGFGAAGSVLYRSFNKVNEQLKGYHAALQKAKENTEKLAAKSDAQTRDLEVYRAALHSLNTVTVQSLIASSAAQRKEIDQLKAQTAAQRNEIDRLKSETSVPGRANTPKTDTGMANKNGAGLGR